MTVGLLRCMGRLADTSETAAVSRLLPTSRALREASAERWSEMQMHPLNDLKS